MKINDLFEMKIIISDFMNKIVDSIISNHVNEFITVKIWYYWMRYLNYDNFKHLIKTVDEIHLMNINLFNSSSYKFLKYKSCKQTFCNRTDLVSRYDDLVEHLSWILIST